MSLARSTRPDFEEIILSLLLRKRRYILIGEVSLETGYQLGVCETKLYELAERGAIVRLTPQEQKDTTLPSQTIAFRLIDVTKFHVRS